MRLLYPLVATLLLLAFSHCQSSRQAGGSAPATVRQVDLRRYAGQWYEVARLPTPFQQDNEGARVEYTPQPDGKLTVVNTAIRPDGSTRSIRGRAEPVPQSGNAKLRVRFEGWAALAPVGSEGNYWVLALDEQYRYAMVGTADRKYLWLLSRTPTLPESTRRQLLAQARAQGYATEGIIVSERRTAR